MFRQELAQLAIFHGLSTRQLDQLSSLLKFEHFHAGETVFEQGKVAHYLYILLRGEVVVRYKPYDGPPLTVARISPGGVFGWSAAMMREFYSSGAEAVADIDTFKMSGQQLRRLCEKDPETGVLLLDRLASVIAERLQGTHTQIVTILTQGMDLENECMNRNGKHDRR